MRRTHPHAAIQLLRERPAPEESLCPGGCGRHVEPFHFVVKGRDRMPARDSHGKLLPSGWTVPTCDSCIAAHEESTRPKHDRLKATGLVGRLQAMTIGTWRVKSQHQERAVRIVGEFIKNPDHNLWLYGSPGTGKTHLAAAIIHARIDTKQKLVFAYTPVLLDELRDSFLSDRSPMLKTSRWAEADLLVLDDLGSQHDTSWSMERLMVIVNERNIHERPTVVTANINPEQMGQLLDDRMISRLMEGDSLSVNLGGEDYRAKPKRRK